MARLESLNIHTLCHLICSCCISLLSNAHSGQCLLFPTSRFQILSHNWIWPKNEAEITEKSSIVCFQLALLHFWYCCEKIMQGQLTGPRRRGQEVCGQRNDHQVQSGSHIPRQPRPEGVSIAENRRTTLEQSLNVVSMRQINDYCVELLSTGCDS